MELPQNTMKQLIKLLNKFLKDIILKHFVTFYYAEVNLLKETTRAIMNGQKRQLNN